MKLTIDQKNLARIAKKYGLRLVILHGSFATKTARKDSDIDIAAIAKKEVSPGKFLDLVCEIARIFQQNKGHEVDFKMLNRVDPLFRYETAMLQEIINWQKKMPQGMLKHCI